MPQYPIEDTAGLYEGINYVLSGPAGLGQNFQGFSAYEKAYLRPTFRAPFTVAGDSTLQNQLVLTVPCSNADPYPSDPTPTIEVTFTSAFTDPPFQQGDRLTLSGWTPSYFDDRYTVLSCSNASVILNYNGTSYSWGNSTVGGNITRDRMNTGLSADNNARVTIYGPTDKAFISCQNNFNVEYSVTGNSGASLQVVSTVERWVGSPVNSSQQEGATDYLFSFQDTVSKEIFTIDNITANGNANVNSLFTTVIDQPNYGYYWYFNNLYFNNVGGITDFYYLRGVQPRAANTGTYSCSFTTVTGTGSGATVDITLSGTQDVYVYNGYGSNFTFTITNGGTGYVVEDEVKITGDQLGGTTPDNDLTLKVFSVDNPEGLYVGNVALGVRSMTAQVVKE